MSWAVIRNWSPLLRTEPSSTLATCNCRAISGISTPLPLNENDEVRAATLSCGIFDSRFSNSSEMPSEKISLFLVVAHVHEWQHRDAVVIGGDSRWACKVEDAP